MNLMLYRGFTQQSEIDAEYNPSRTATEPQAALDHFVGQARLAREKLDCVLNVPYGATLDETLDIFPAAERNAPVWMFIHGGYWRSMSSKDFSGVALGPHALGFTTVVVNYALCPGVTIDEIVRQIRASLAWVHRNISAYGADPTRIVLGGHSAGAHLTAMAIMTPWATQYGMPETPVSAAMLISGVFDLRPLKYSYLQPALQLDDGLIQRCSPLLRLEAKGQHISMSGKQTPVLVSWGAMESREFQRQSTDFHEAWTASGGRSETHCQDSRDHFSALHGFEHNDHSLCQWMADTQK